MYDEPEMIKCPGCDERFYVVWQRSATTGDGPTYCPFCGDEIESAYKKAWDKNDP